MREQDKATFVGLLEDIYDFYGKELTERRLIRWWNAMQPYEIKTLVDTFDHHVVGEKGPFFPTPADIVLALQGTSEDSALLACSKVESTLRTVGTYASVVFDDVIIQLVIQDMGGWIELGKKKEAEWPFVRNEFVKRYRGYCQGSSPKTWPAVLIGMAQASNECNGFASAAPVLIGNQQQAQYVLSGGTHTNRVGITRLGEQVFKQIGKLPHLEQGPSTTTTECTL